VNIPVILHGLYADARTKSRTSLSALRRGQSWEQATEQPGFLDTRTTPGLIIVHGPSPLLNDAPHFHSYLLHSMVRDAYLERKIDKEMESLAFEASLGSAWATLGLMCEPSLGFLYPSSRHRPFLKAVLQFWEVYAAEGARFSDGRDWGIDLWSAQSNLQYVLVNLGVPESVLRSFRPPQHPKQLLAYIPSEL
jgi:hypothetical protein